MTRDSPSTPPGGAPEPEKWPFDDVFGPPHAVSRPLVHEEMHISGRALAIRSCTVNTQVGLPESGVFPRSGSVPRHFPSLSRLPSVVGSPRVCLASLAREGCGTMECCDSCRAFRSLIVFASRCHESSAVASCLPRVQRTRPGAGGLGSGATLNRRPLTDTTGLSCSQGTLLRLAWFFDPVPHSPPGHTVARRGPRAC